MFCMKDEKVQKTWVVYNYMFEKLNIVKLKLMITHYVRACSKNAAGHGSWIGCASTWYADGRRFDPHIW